MARVAVFGVGGVLGHAFCIVKQHIGGLTVDRRQ